MTVINLIFFKLNSRNENGKLGISADKHVKLGDEQSYTHSNRIPNLKAFPSTGCGRTCVDGRDASASGIPDCLETKVSAAVGLLVQADPHFTVVFLNTTHHEGDE